MKKRILIVLLLMLFVGLVAGAKERSIVALPGHELGDQTFSIGVGLFLPLFFQDFTGQYFPANSSIGASGYLNWNAYINSFFRIGLEFGGAFCFDVNLNSIIFLPLSVKGTYVFNIERFEVPVSVNIGANIGKYGEEFSNIFLFVKPAVSCFYRWDANLSFGGTLGWWWNLEFPTDDPAIMANQLEITPALFYHF